MSGKSQKYAVAKKQRRTPYSGESMMEVDDYPGMQTVATPLFAQLQISSPLTGFRFTLPAAQTTSMGAMVPGSNTSGFAAPGSAPTSTFANPSAAAQFPRPFISQSEGFLQSPSVMSTAGNFSMPSVLPRTKMVTYQDEFGITKCVAVTTEALADVRALLRDADSNGGVPPIRYTHVRQQGSVGSLSSTSSPWSSTASIPSVTSVASSTTSSSAINVDPVAAIRQQYQLLLQMGRRKEASDLVHELQMNLFAPQQQHQQNPSQFGFLGQVSTDVVSVKESEEGCESSSMTNGNDLNKLDNTKNGDAEIFLETSSEKCVQPSLCSKPKKGFFKKFHLSLTSLTRLFTAKVQ